MRVAPWGFAAVSLLALGAGRAAAGPTILGSADFEDKTLDAPIETGGPSVGEPVSVSSAVTAVVRSAPMTTSSLEISDNHEGTAGGTRFELFGHQEPTDGVVTFSLELWFAGMEDYYVYIREQGGSAKSFLSLLFQSGGTVRYNDTTSGGVLGTYETGRVVPLRLDFDMLAGTYDIWIDGTQVLDDRAHGIDDRGVGAILVGCSHDLDTDGTFYLDNLMITGDGVTPALESTWGAVKSSFRP